MWKTVLVICVGASLGALLRYWLGVVLNEHFPTIPPGTLAANLIGAYIVGLALAYFSTNVSIAPEWRILIITGFCGGLTTFSTFSAEIVTLLEHGRATMAFAAIVAHVGGSLLMTFAGISTSTWVRG